MRISGLKFLPLWPDISIVIAGSKTLVLCQMRSLQVDNVSMVRAIRLLLKGIIAHRPVTKCRRICCEDLTCQRSG